AANQVRVARLPAGRARGIVPRAAPKRSRERKAMRGHRLLALAVALTVFCWRVPADAAELKTAVFAAGCFWCVEEAFDKVPGVRETISGYIGGEAATATYGQVSGGGTGHYEAVEVRYDPAEVTYARLLEVFWHNTDPFDARGQFCDKGTQYLSAIFVANDEER